MTEIPKLARLAALTWLLLISMPTSAQVTLLVLDFEFVDELHDPRTAEADQKRLLLVNETLGSQIEACTAFRKSDPAPALATISQMRSRVAYLHRCNGCAVEIGAAAETQLVMFPWVQKVSNLILNLNIEVRSAATDRVVAVRSVDIRGNTDRSWLRGAKALAIRLCELDGERLSREPPR